MTDDSPLTVHKLLSEKCHNVHDLKYRQPHSKRHSFQPNLHSFIHAGIHSFMFSWKRSYAQLPMHTAFELSTHIIELWYIEPWANIGKQHDLICCHHKWAIWMIVTNIVTYFCWSYNSCLCGFWSMKYFTLHSNKKVESVLLFRSYAFMTCPICIPSYIWQSFTNNWEAFA